MSNNPAGVRLLIADVDGTLVTKEKSLTDRTKKAVTQLKEAGVLFALTSGRPPRGMSMLVEPLHVTEPIAAFNGGMFVHPDLSPIDAHVLPSDVVRKVIETLRMHQLDVWIYRGNDWFVHQRHGPHVDHEEFTVKFPPTVLASFDDMMDNVVKVVGVSDDLEAVARCETDTRNACGKQVSAARSQPYYLDVTHPDANKGMVVKRLSQILNIPPAQIATIGDMPNDMLMFEQSGVSIAMGNASAEVQHAAHHVTRSNEEEGFALAIEQFVLPKTG